MGANGTILATFLSGPSIDAPARVTRQGPPILPAADEPARLTTSVFQIDHRGELIKELLHDAEVLDKQAAEATALALSLRLTADHLKANPPDA